MQHLTIHISKINVYNEVAMTTSYVGRRETTDESNHIYDQIYSSEADREKLERFWREACLRATDLFKPFVEELRPQTEAHGVLLTSNYRVVLALPPAFDARLGESIETELFSFFVEDITASWFRLMHGKEAESYERRASELLERIRVKLYYRKTPNRIKPQ